MYKTALFLFLAATALAQPVITATGPSTVYPGQSLTVTVALTGTAGSGLAAAQWSQAIPAGMGFTSAAPTSAYTAAGWGIYCSPTTGAICIDIDFNGSAAGQALLADGILATETVTLSQSATPGNYSIPFSGFVGSTTQGAAVTVTGGAVYSFVVLSPCSFSGSPANISDILLVLNAALGVGGCPANVTAAGKTCNLVTLQQTIYNVLGGACLL